MMDFANWRLRGFAKAMVLDEAEQREAQANIAQNAELGLDYLLFIVLSCVVATCGLITNSAPVIIGAMVLAPLMNPVLGVAMGVVRGDVGLLLRGLKTLSVGLVLGFAIATLAAWLVPELTLTSEIQGRTHPTIYDLFIGMAAGAGGALGQARRSVAGVLPGAAIAVSLMPPLCVTGISFSVLLGAAPLSSSSPLSMVFGSALLWMANLAAINLAAIVVFLLLGFRKIREGEGDRHFRRRITLSAVLVLCLTFPLVAFLNEAVARGREERMVKAAVSAFVQDTLDIDAELTSFHLGPPDPVLGWRSLVVNVASPRLPERSEVVGLRTQLEGFLGTVDLKLNVNPTHTYRENPKEGSISDRPVPLRRP